MEKMSKDESRKKLIELFKLKEDINDFIKENEYNTTKIDALDKIEMFEIFININKSVQDDVINILDKLEIKGVREKHNNFGVSVLADKDMELKEVINTYKKIKNIFADVLCFVEFEKQGRVIMKDYLKNLLIKLD